MKEKDQYEILARHFQGETNREEEEQVFLFRKENRREYEILHRLWQETSIEVRDYDSVKAWKKIASRTGQRAGKPIPLFGNFRRIAATIAILLAGSLTTYVVIRNWQSSEVLVETVYDKSGTIILEDGSQIWMNHNSILSYPRNFSVDSREVSISGEAYFDVAKDVSRPFVIQTTQSKIRVLGTSFNVRTDDAKTEVSVETGTVEVVSATNMEKVILMPDQRALITTDTLVSYENPDPNYLSWKTGKFVFDNTPIEIVIRDLNRYYDIQLSVSPEIGNSCNLTASFNQEELADILEIIKITCDATLVESGSKILIK